MTDEPVLFRLDGVTKRYRRRRARRDPAGSRWVDAVSGVDLDVPRAAIIAVVGASGAGKTTVGRIMSLLERPTTGHFLLAGRPVDRLRRRERRAVRRMIQVVHQDPFEALDPRYTVGRCVAEGLYASAVSAARRRELVLDALEEVELMPAEWYWNRRPRQLSGGQRQRVAIARALVGRPALIVADEPVAALDVSIRAGVLRLFEKIRADLGTAVILITHDLGVARAVADEIVVMQEGGVVEHGPTDRVLDDPQHEYTRRLLRAAPRLTVLKEEY